MWFHLLKEKSRGLRRGIFAFGIAVV